MDKRIILGAIICIAFLGAEPQLRLGLGQTDYPKYKHDMRFKGNNSFIECTFNPYSRLQFGLKYENTETVLGEVRRLGVYGFMATFKFYLNTLTDKTPYFGYNVGWLNADLIDYSAHGAYCTEYVGGYSFRLDDWSRINFEYLHQIMEDALGPGEPLNSEVLTISWAVILDMKYLFTKPLRHQTPEEGVTTRKKYLQRKIEYNLDQIQKYDTLIAKYNQNILENPDNENLRTERDYLLTQRNILEEDNKQILELLEI